VNWGNLALVSNGCKWWKNDERKEKILLKWSENHGEILRYLADHKREKKKELGLLWCVWILWNYIELIVVIMIKNWFEFMYLSVMILSI
jgi:hypothetical protein